MTRIAHLSDLHVLALEGVPLWRLLTGKRLTGYFNLLLRRGAAHSAALAHHLLEDLAQQDVDHVVITGDMTNLALESEFAAARRLLERRVGLPANRITVIPGNHDRYTRGAFVSKRFENTLEPYLQNDLKSLGTGTFPVVRLLKDTAIIGLNSAVPRLPFIASGQVGSEQVDALKKLLRAPELQGRFVMLAVHHPVVYPVSAAKVYIKGLRDADRLVQALAHWPAGGLVLHGHLHRRMCQRVDGTNWWSVGATSLSLNDAVLERMAGYNLYEVGAGAGVPSVSARVFDASEGACKTYALTLDHAGASATSGWWAAPSQPVAGATIN